jgi:WhiB family transcriptional regulator, redox-sensing transcriptional regulator
MTARANWRDDAACRDADPDLFFPIGTTGPALRQIGEAKRFCRTCPAQTQCLAWALDNRVINGVWGGTAGEERRAMRSLHGRMTTRQEDDDGEGHQPTGHEEQGIRAQAAQGKATRIFSGARAGDILRLHPRIASALIAWNLSVSRLLVRSCSANVRPKPA